MTGPYHKKNVEQMEWHLVNDYRSCKKSYLSCMLKTIIRSGHLHLIYRSISELNDTVNSQSSKMYATY